MSTGYPISKESFSQPTSDLRKRLDEENIPWVDDSEVIRKRDGYSSVYERTVLIYNKRLKYSVFLWLDRS